MILRDENRSTRRKICPSATLSTTNPTWTGLGVNPGLRGERPTTNRLGHRLFSFPYHWTPICFLALHPPQWAMASSLMRFLDHTQRHTTVGTSPLDEWPARPRHLYLTTHNTHNRQISLTPAGLEPAISASERQQTYALDRAATGTGWTPNSLCIW